MFRSPTATSALGLGLVFTVVSPRAAQADARQECSDAYTETQVLRDAGKLDEGMQAAAVCSREVCALFMREDCLRWKEELEGRVASIIVEVVDGAGAARTDGTVLLDGKPWLPALDGAAHAVAKGDHVVEIRPRGEPAQKKSILVVEGEKNRRITFSLGGPPMPVEREPTVHDIAPWVIGGVGLGALIASAVTGGLVVNAYAVTQDECDDATRSCSPDGASAQDRGRILGPVTTALLVGGGVMVAGAIVWLVVAPDDPAAPSTSFFVAPAVAPGEQGVVVGGSF